MNLIAKGQKSSHRGIVGVDAAILLIAFVIVAAGFAFVMVNMGFSSTQKTKTVIVSGLSSAGTGLQVSGKVMGAGHISDAKVNVTGIPIKIASSGNPVDLDPAFTAIKFQGAKVKYDNIYVGTINPGVPGEGIGKLPSLEEATNIAEFFSWIDKNPYKGGDFGVDDFPSKTVAFVYWSVNENDNNVLDEGEHAVLAIVFAEEDRPKSRDKIYVELIPASGGSLTVERTIPLFNSELVWIG